MDETKLKQLMRSVAQNLDRSAFAELFDIMAPRVKSSLMRSGLSPEGAEDVLQDVMISLWTKAGLYDYSKGTVAAWVFTIARNARIDRVRREKPTTSIDLVGWDPIDEGGNSEDQLVLAQDTSALRQALNAIPPEQREILELAYVKELSQVDIAERLAVPLGTVKSRMRLAYAHLRKILEN